MSYGEIDDPMLSYARLIRRLNQARPSHEWTPFADRTVGREVLSKPGCQRCPATSPFHKDRRSHLYRIEEEL